MRRVIRRALVVGALALLLAAGVAMAAAPGGPRLALVKLTTKPTRLELMTVDPNGGLPLRLAGGGRRARPLPFFFAPLSWAADGGQLAFSAIVASKGGDGPDFRIYLVNADGGGLRPVPKTSNGYGPVLSPDGHTLAFTRFRELDGAPGKIGGKMREAFFEGATLWTIDLDTGKQRQLTPWRNGLEYHASSFSPDGTTMLATRSDDRRTDTPEPVAIRLDSGGVTRLLVDGLFPVYSPDGSKIAVFREVGEDIDLYVLDVAGGSVQRLTRTPGNVELFASWDPSGERLAFMRFSSADSEPASLGIGDSLMQVNADGTCPTKTLAAPRTGFYVPAWQPGPGREAGRIAC